MTTNYPMPVAWHCSNNAASTCRSNQALMAFPDIQQYPQSTVGPYEHQMGSAVASLLRRFDGHVADAESHRYVSELAATPDRWSAAHAVCDELSHRLAAASNAGDQLRLLQYWFERSCCEALYNATDPSDPFDPSAPFFVAGNALRLAESVGLPNERIFAVLAPHPRP